MTFGSFQILNKIFEGPLTTVYKAHQTGPERVVLLKVLHPHLKNETELVARFQREAQACARIQHDNIVEVYEFSQIDESWYMAMEFVEGQTLRDVLNQRGKLPPAEADSIMRDCLLGIAAAHDKAVIHRDIKPANILIDPKGRARLTDFGLASIHGGSTLTQNESAVGTPAYISPEQLNGGPLDGRADLFALGAVYYEMLTGEQIFGGETFTDSFTKVLTKTVPKLSDASPELNEFIQKLLAKSREQRFSSAQATLRAFEAVCSLQFKDATPTADDSKPIKMARWKHPRIGAAVLIILLIAFVMTMTMVFRSDQPELPPDRVNLNTLDSSLSELKTPVDASGQLQNDLADTVVDIETANLDSSPNTSDVLSANTPSEEATSPPPPDTTLIEEMAAQPPPQRTDPDSGQLRITCKPWATVRLDDELLGTTPLPGPISLPVGNYSLRFENPAFPAVTRQVSVAADDITTWHEDLWQHVGFLWVTAVPWADVYLNQEHVATTPINEPLLRPVGSYSLILKHPAFSDQQTKITISPGDTTRVFCRMGETIKIQ